MKKKLPQKKSLIRQLISGTVYIALAAVVVAVTINTTVGLISDKTEVPKFENTSDGIDTSLPNLPEIPPLSFPNLNISETPDTPQDSAVSDTVQGIDALVTEPSEETIEPSEISEEIIPRQIDIYGIPTDANLGLGKFIKPCSGYISREHSAEIPVYSPTMSDYRTHIGVDVVGDIGSEVVCVNGGIVKNIYNDDLFGMTVEMTNRDGYCIRYSNLQPQLDAEVTVGAILKTGSSIGGIGETAICESLDTPHVHLEIYDSDGNPVDPEELIDF